MLLSSSSVMKFYAALYIFVIFGACVASAIPKPDEDGKTKNRILDKELSDKEHYVGDDHDADYDHEAFLGDESKNFDQMSPTESKEKLGFIYDKIDKNGDQKVSEEEMHAWIKYVQNKYVLDDADRQWKDHVEDLTDDSMPWEAYRKSTYGVSQNDVDPEDAEGYNYKDMISRDEKRWAKADLDGNKLLSKEEFVNFLHPEESEHMKDVVIDETLQDIDKDGDGKIGLDEYIGDMYSGNAENDVEEPEWVESERKVFHDQRDLDHSGFMERREVQKWIMPEENHMRDEATHLFSEADADKDGFLTKAEVLDKYDLFVGSQATDFGDALNRHDEF